MHIELHLPDRPPGQLQEQLPATLAAISTRGREKPGASFPWTKAQYPLPAFLSAMASLRCLAGVSIWVDTIFPVFAST
jgi:hypothetical protein